MLILNVGQEPFVNRHNPVRNLPSSNRPFSSNHPPARTIPSHLRHSACTVVLLILQFTLPVINSTLSTLLVLVRPNEQQLSKTWTLKKSPEPSTTAVTALSCTNDIARIMCVLFMRYCVLFAGERILRRVDGMAKITNKHASNDYNFNPTPRPPRKQCIRIN